MDYEHVRRVTKQLSRLQVNFLIAAVTLVVTDLIAVHHAAQTVVNVCLVLDLQ